jgi:type IV secretory pathway TraG/TraD family ATPase VirD4
MSDDRVTYIGRINHRNAGTLFGIRQRDRRSHFYVIGKTGVGKSHLLRIMIEQDIVAGEGCALFDPHGDLVRQLHGSVPATRTSDVTYLDAGDPTLRWRFNPFRTVDPGQRALVAAQTIDVFRKLWPDEWGPRLEHLLRNVVLTLLETPGSTLADIPALLTDRDSRSRFIANLADPVVSDFWKNEYERYSPPFRAVIVAPLQNKIGALLTDPTLRRLFTEDGEQLDLKALMDGGKILLVNLDKGRIGEGPSMLLGSLLVSHIALTGLSRSAQPENERRDFFVYLDEFQTFTTLALTTMMSELRKYRVSLVLSHQHLAQLETEIRDAVFGNVGSMVAFRVGAQDAAFMARECAPKFDSEDLIALPKYHTYIKLQIDGATSAPFSATTLDRLPCVA